MLQQFRNENSALWMGYRTFVFLFVVMTAAATIGAVVSLLQTNNAAAAAWASCAAIGSCAVIGRRSFPPLFGFLITLAASVNVTAYVFTLLHERTPFDEFVHAHTTFAGIAAIG